MNREDKKNRGIKKLLRKYKDAFRIPENVNHYSQEDFKIAERKFLKNAVTTGEVEALAPQREEPS